MQAKNLQRAQVRAAAECGHADARGLAVREVELVEQREQRAVAEGNRAAGAERRDYQTAQRWQLRGGEVGERLGRDAVREV